MYTNMVTMKLLPLFDLKKNVYIEQMSVHVKTMKNLILYM